MQAGAAPDKLLKVGGFLGGVLAGLSVCDVVARD